MSINDTLDRAEAVICPQRGFRIVWKVVAILLIIAIAGVVLRTTYRVLGRSETAVTLPAIEEGLPARRAWFSRTFEEVRALDAEVSATEEALKRKQVEAESRWVSRSDDRAEFNRLSNRISELKAQRAQLVKEYNTNAAIDPAMGIAPIGT